VPFYGVFLGAWEAVLGVLGFLGVVFWWLRWALVAVDGFGWRWYSTVGGGAVPVAC
jgi:hypothetical protein